MADIVRAIDDSPLFKLLTDCVMSAPGFLARGLSNVVQGATEIAGGVVAGISAIKENIGATMSGPDRSDGQEQGVKLGRSADLHMGRVSQQDLGQYGVTMDDVVAPTVGAKMQQSVGVSV